MGRSKKDIESDLREHTSSEDRVAEYNNSIETLRLKTGTTSERDVDPEDVGEDYGLVKGHRIPVESTTPRGIDADEPRHTAMRALIATVVATGCTCSRCERLREFVPEIGRTTLKKESQSFEEQHNKRVEQNKKYTKQWQMKKKNAEDASQT